MLAKKKPKITYGSRVEVEAYIHWAEDPGVLPLSYKPCEPSSSKSHKKQLILCYLPEVANNKIVVPKHQ
jgi:hypothetical protein